MHMKTNTVVLSGAVALVVVAGVSLATPIVGLLSPLLSVGTANSELHARGSALISSSERFHVELETEGPSFRKALHHGAGQGPQDRSTSTGVCCRAGSLSG